MPVTIHQKTSCQKNRYKWIAAGSLLTVVLSVLYVFSDSSGNELPPSSSTTENRMMVSIVSTKPDTYRSVIESRGEVLPLWQTRLKTEVNGQIIQLSEQLRQGVPLTKGDTLITLEDSYYQTQLARATSQLASARVNLTKAEKKARQSPVDWKRTGISKQPDELVLHIPQLKAAKAAFKAAEAEVQRSQVQLQQTVITMPYNGVVIDRKVSLGDAVQQGDELAVVYGLEKAIIPVALDQQQWQQMPEQWQGQTATLSDPFAGQSWSARMVRSSITFDRQTRLRTVFLEVDQPLTLTPALLPGHYLSVQIEGKRQDGILRLPESSLDRNGYVWFVDNHNHLQRFPATPLFTRQGYVFVEPPETKDHWRIVTTPLVDYLPGMPVATIESGLEQS